MIRRIAWAPMLALLLSACGGAGTPTPESPTSTTTTPVAETGSEENLVSFFGWNADESPAAAEARGRQQQAEIEEAVQRCMREQGFEYTPVQPPEGAFTFSSEDEGEQRETQGFGITTWYGNEDAFDGGIEWNDPNHERISAMSEGEQEAYWEALYGDPEEVETTEVDPETGEEITYSTGMGGCQGEAHAAVYGDPESSQRLWEQLEPAFAQLADRVAADPRMIEVAAGWSSCMATAGFEFATREDMWETVFDDFQTRLDAITGSAEGTDPFAGMTEDEVNAFFEERTDEEIEAFFEEQRRQEMESIDREALDALQQEEIALAVADTECGEGYDEVSMEVSAEYERVMIDENREILEQIRQLEGNS